MLHALYSGLVHGLFSPPWWGYLLYLLIVTHITIATVTLYYHRSQAHGAVEFHPWIDYFFRTYGWVTTGMIIKEWVAIHRLHHAKDDGEGDPHSPQVYGFWKVFPIGVWLYYVAAVNAAKTGILHRYGQNTPRDALERKVFMKYPWLGVVIMLVIDVTLFGLVGAGIWLVQMLWIPFFAAGVINGIGHWPLFKQLIGYRNSDTADASSNIVPWGILIGGEELHNNHHAYPLSAKLSLQPYEFDIGWMYIKILEYFGLAKVKRCIPHEVRSRELRADTSTITLIRGDKGYLTAAGRKILLAQARRELRDQKLASVHAVIAEVRMLLMSPKWYDNGKAHRDALLQADEKIRQLKGSGSILPRIGAFISLFHEIRKNNTEVGGSNVDREASLITELNAWIDDMRASGVTRAKAFAERLARTVIYRPKRA